MGVILKRTGIGISLLVLVFLLPLMSDTQLVKAPGDAWITLDPTRIEVHRGDNFTITVSASNVDLMDTWLVFLKYNLTIVSVTDLWIPVDNVFGDPNVVMQVSTGPDYGREWFLYGMNYVSFGNSLSTGNVSVAEGILFKANCTALSEGSTSIMIATKDNRVAVGEWIPDRFSTLLLYDALGNSEREIAQPVRVQNTALIVSRTIFIGADGSIDPSTDSMQRDGDLYTLSGNVTSNADGIVVERDNIVVDGSGYTVEGAGAFTSSLYGICLDGRINVTICNTNIKNFNYGIRLYSSSNNSINGNTVTNNYYQGISLDYSSSNSINGNNITNNWGGILLRYSSNNSVRGNAVTNNSEGICLAYSSDYNSINGNTITNNSYEGILLDYSSNNSICHNNFINNTRQVYYIVAPVANIWDDGYPAGGNYWSDYVARYPNATQIDASGIWNTACVIDANNTDHYPLMNPYTRLVGDVNGDSKVDMRDVGYVARRSMCLPDDPLWDSGADVNGDGKIDTVDIKTVAGHFGEHYP